MKDIIINVRSIDIMAMRGETEDGFLVRVDLCPDQHGRFGYLVQGNGYTDRSNAATVDAALMSARMAISGRRRTMNAKARTYHHEGAST